MNYLEVSPYGIVGRDFLVLTYSSAEPVLIGAVVEISVGKRKYVGVVVKRVEKPKFKCKEILRVLTERPLPPQLLKLHEWMSSYYATHPGAVWQTMLPAGLNKNRRFNRSDLRDGDIKSLLFRSDLIENRTNILFTPDQSNAITKLLKMPSGTAILHGVTGSGKTEVYKALAMEAATRGKSSIILVPEISLTAQLVNEFRRDFTNVIVTHSTMTETERHVAWLAALNTNEPTIVIGPRSALFMPLQNLGLVVIDECHEPSYKQEKSPRYSALRAVSKLVEFTNTTSLRARPSTHSVGIGAAGAERRSNPKSTSPESRVQPCPAPNPKDLVLWSLEPNCRLILGSATPLISDYYVAKKLGRPIVEMKQLARRDAKRPKTTIVDMTKRDARSKNPIFSRQLLDAMEKALAGKKQVMLFHNRRGSAPLTICEDCSWSAMCPRCFIPLTLHVDKHQLRCRLCGHNEPPPTRCPSCGGAGILHRGIGTKRIEEEVRKLFPLTKVQRFDGDNIKGEGVHDMFNELKTGDIDIIIGTQTIAKGLDLPNLALVGIPQADIGLMLPDFSSTERTFQLIAQAAGRVGRDKNDTQVIIQTYQPNHPAVIFGAAQDYASFYNYEIKNRQKGHFPPFSHLLKLTNSYKSEKSAVASARKLAAVIQDLFRDPINKSSPQATKLPPARVKILGPTPCFYERLRDNYRWQIVVRATNRADLTKISELVPTQKWQSELDPNSLI